MFSLFRKTSKTPAKLPFVTDVHCHLVPDVDDGSPDVETSIDLLSRMQQWGIERIVMTPHMTQDSFENTPDILDPAFESLREEAAKFFPDLQMVRSCEHRIDEFFLSQLEQGLIVPFPNNYLLVENSFMQEPWNMDQIIFDLKLAGYKPIIAHPERFIYYQHNRGRYKQLHQAGNLIQVNVLSLAGYYGKQTKATAEWLLEQGYVGFIGTDLHHHRHADAIDAYLRSRDYQKLLQSKVNLFNDVAFD